MEKAILLDTLNKLIAILKVNGAIYDCDDPEAVLSLLGALAELHAIDLLDESTDKGGIPDYV